MKLLIGTQNPEKIEGAKQAFKEYFDSVSIKGIPVASEVGIQPVNEEILKGARNRIKNLKKYAKENNMEADYYLSCEGGMTNLLGEWIDIQCVVVENSDGLQSVATSQGFPVPERYIDEIRKSELKVFMNKLFKEWEMDSTKRGVYSLTGQKVTRTDLIKNAFMMALTKFINGDIWK